MSIKTIDDWMSVKMDLGIEIIGPFILEIGNDISLSVDMLVENFGGPKGTLVINDYDRIKDIKERIREAGYSWSYISAPSRLEPYDREGTIEVLLDWGWSGPSGGEPGWYKDGIEKYR